MEKQQIKRTKLGFFGRQISINKIKLVRGYSYISAFAIPFLVAAQMSEMITILPWWGWFILSMVGVWVVGHIDFHRLWKNELEFTLTKNPEWTRKMREMIKEELKEDVRKNLPRK